MIWVRNPRIGENLPDTERMCDIQFHPRLHQQDHRTLYMSLNLPWINPGVQLWLLTLSMLTDSSFKSLPKILLFVLKFRTLGFESASELAYTSSHNCNPSCTQMSNLSSFLSSAKKCAGVPSLRYPQLFCTPVKAPTIQNSPHYFSVQNLKTLGTSLMVQWLGLVLPMQGAGVWSLVRQLYLTCYN